MVQTKLFLDLYLTKFLDRLQQKPFFSYSFINFFHKKWVKKFSYIFYMKISILVLFRFYKFSLEIIECVCEKS